eukprot:TRINITY_DN2276_c0_g1_i1.p1 TRINITY_DN2276_c0_g1~~TRINITY_DN2276_c0_g1_i1.p1  ORF type:complete len:245 (+),score=44.44 TRINITY_DN2276_c0_g1_i1:182-916(+)
MLSSEPPSWSPSWDDGELDDEPDATGPLPPLISVNFEPRTCPLLLVACDPSACSFLSALCRGAHEIGRLSVAQTSEGASVPVANVLEHSSGVVCVGITAPIRPEHCTATARALLDALSPTHCQVLECVNVEGRASPDVLSKPLRVLCTKAELRSTESECFSLPRLPSSLLLRDMSAALLAESEGRQGACAAVLLLHTEFSPSLHTVRSFEGACKCHPLLRGLAPVRLHPAHASAAREKECSIYL